MRGDAIEPVDSKIPIRFQVEMVQQHTTPHQHHRKQELTLLSILSMYEIDIKN